MATAIDVTNHAVGGDSERGQQRVARSVAIAIDVTNHAVGGDTQRARKATSRAVGGDSER